MNVQDQLQEVSPRSAVVFPYRDFPGAFILEVSRPVSRLTYPVGQGVQDALTADLGRSIRELP